MPTLNTYQQGPKSVNDGRLAAVPSGAAANLYAFDVWVTQITVINNSGGAATLIIQDQQASPAPLIANQSFNDKTTTLFVFGDPVYCPGGLKWGTNAAGNFWVGIQATRKGP